MAKEKVKASKKKIETIDDSDLYTDEGKKATLLTKEGLKKIVEELEYLKTTKRREVAGRIKEAKQN